MWYNCDVGYKIVAKYVKDNMKPIDISLSLGQGPVEIGMGHPSNP